MEDSVEWGVANEEGISGYAWFGFLSIIGGRGIRKLKETQRGCSIKCEARNIKYRAQKQLA